MLDNVDFLKQCSSLIELDMQGVEIQDLTPFTHLPNLKILFLSKDEINLDNPKNTEIAASIKARGVETSF